MKKLLNSLREKWNNWLKKLAESNSHVIGSGRADCCSLNSRPNHRSQTK